MTSAERKRKERIAKRKSGLVPKEVWTTPTAWPRIKAYIDRELAKERRP